MRKLLSVLSSTLQGGVRGGLLFVTLIATTSLWAHDFAVKGIYYNYLEGNNVEVTYKGDDYYDYDDEYSGAVTIPETVTYSGKTYSVTSIGYDAFHSCSSLTSVTIPNSVTSIGERAFIGCRSLTSITIPNSVTSIGDYAFRSCSSLTSVTIPNSVTSIGDDAFYNCISLTSVTIGNSVTSIGSSAFCDCYSLTSVTIGNSVTSIGDCAFRSCSLTSITIPNSVTSIGGYAFSDCSSLTTPVYNAHCFAYMPTSFKGAYVIPEGIKQIAGGAFDDCSSLTSVTIPNSVTSIGYGAFSDCSSLTSLTIPNSVTSIENYAFYDCTSLTSITIPNSVTSIGDWAFSHCSSLTSVTIGNSVTSIGRSAFDGCYSLTSVTIPNSVTSIGYGAFSDCTSLTSVTIGNSVTSIGYYAFDGCYSLTSVTLNSDSIVGKSYYYSNNIDDIFGSQVKEYIIGYSVTSIGDYAFAECSSLTSITIPNSVTSIGEYAFDGCSSLTSITIPNSVTSIGEGAFFDCSSLTSITIPNSVTSIGTWAFRECSSLDTITCLAMTPPALGVDVFYGCDNATLLVPCEALVDYEAHEIWGQFTDIECISSEEAETEEVVIESGSTTVIITWPTEEGADTYTIVIKKDGEVVCTLTFNAEGQLLNIAFAPGRDGNHPVQYAEQAGKGYRFTVTGLEEGTHYAYNIDVRDAANKTIKSHTGEFTTESLTAVENITTNNANIQKILRDGQLLILRDGKTYNVMGQEL